MKLLTVNAILLLLIGGIQSLTCLKCTESSFNSPLNEPCTEDKAISCPRSVENACVSLAIDFKFDNDGSEEDVTLKIYGCGVKEDEDLEKNACGTYESYLTGREAADTFPGARDVTCHMADLCQEDLCTMKKKEDETGGDQTDGDKRDCETEFCNAAQGAHIQLFLTVISAMIYGLF